MCFFSSFGQSNLTIADDKYASPFIAQFEFNQNYFNLTDEAFYEKKSTAIIPLPNLDSNLLKELSPTKFINLKWEKLQIDLKSLLTPEKPSLFNNKKIHDGGFINIEAYASNTVLPFSANEATYLRSWGNPSVSVFNLPFQMNYYFTTENNNVYNSNSITFRFDIEQFRTNIEKAQKAKVEEAKNLYKDLSALESEIEIYKKELYAAKRQMTNRFQNELGYEPEKQLDFDKHDLQDSFAHRINSKKREINKRAHDSIDIQNIDALNGLNSKYNKERKDSILEVYQNRKLELENNVNQLDHFLKFTDSIALQIKHHKELIQKIKNADFKLEHLINEKEINAKRSSLDSIEKSKKTIQKKLESIEDFEFGLFNTFYSKNSLNGIPIRGINLKLESKDLNAYTRVSVGATINQFNSSFSSFEINSNIKNNNLFKTHYNRRIAAIKLGIGNEFDNTFYYVSLYSWDQNNYSDNFSNTVNGFGGNYRWKNIQFDGEIMHSIYNRHSSLNNISEGSNMNSLNIFKQRLALASEIKYKLNSSTNTKFKLDQKNLGFRSVGTPFSQNDYRIMEFNLNKTFLKNKITLQGFYKYLNNNLTKISESKNELKGLGLTAQSNFKKYPNLLFAYYPFEQSNYHIDSTQRTNNKFKSLIIQLSYQKSWQNNFSYSLINYNLATIEYHEFGLQSALTKIFSVSEIVQNDKYHSSLNYLLNLTKPTIDSLNYHAINFSVSRKFKKIEFEIDGQQKYTFSNGKSLIHGLTFRYKNHSRFNFAARVGFGYLNNVWNVSELYYFHCRMNLTISL